MSATIQIRLQDNYRRPPQFGLIEEELVRTSNLAPTGKMKSIAIKTHTGRINHGAHG
jgi:hypothetical protein